MDYRAGLELAGPLMRFSCREFLNELSTDSPAPGGGSVAALAGSLSASLAAMVANLTTRHKAYKEVRVEMYDLAAKGQEVKDRLCLLVDEDTEAFNLLLASFRLPKGTDEEQAARQAAIEEATKAATLVPLGVMEQSLEAIGLARQVAEKGMKASASDAGVSALMGRAAVDGAHLNVLINVPNIDDEAWVEDIVARAGKLAAKADEEAKAVVATVRRSQSGNSVPWASGRSPGRSTRPGSMMWRTEKPRAVSSRAMYLRWHPAGSRSAQRRAICASRAISSSFSIPSRNSSVRMCSS